MYSIADECDGVSCVSGNKFDCDQRKRGDDGCTQNCSHLLASAGGVGVRVMAVLADAMCMKVHRSNSTAEKSVTQHRALKLAGSGISLMGMNAAEETQLTSLVAPAYHGNCFSIEAQKGRLSPASRSAQR